MNVPWTDRVVADPPLTIPSAALRDISVLFAERVGQDTTLMLLGIDVLGVKAMRKCCAELDSLPF